MPTISMFYGIIVRMFAESGGQHNLPHIHAAYSREEVVMDLDGNVIEGKLPKGKMRLLLAWLEIHREDLKANWELLSNNEPAFKIEPLK
ncbi:MAG: DUF4160 domain-containing protein [Oscillospiraceae bacterium]|jgi:hypothetical protein|nr:DUF4160 domain-containing protein [Oscillospiraceae bacterium]